MKESSGTLYICPTPLGNLEDITLRVLRILKEVDLIAAEETHHTQKLLHHFDIHTPMISYYDSGNATIKEERLLESLQQGKSIALVSSAGTPLISDPGFKLIQKCLEHNVQVIPLPGPSAAITALTVSGLPTHNFFFAGFLPSKSTGRKAALQELADYPFTLIFYEAPHRILECLKDCKEILGDRPAAVARELTKIHEEVLRGILSDVIKKLQERPIRGEFTLVIGGDERTKEINWDEISDELKKSLEKGKSVLEVSKELAKKYGLQKNKIYALAHRLHP